MIWMLSNSGKIHHIKVMLPDESAVTEAYPSSVCGCQLSTARTNYWSTMLIPNLGFRKCRRCLRWQRDTERSRR